MIVTMTVMMMVATFKVMKETLVGTSYHRGGRNDYHHHIAPIFRRIA